MTHTATNENLAALDERRKELEAQSAALEAKIDRMDPPAVGVIDDTQIIAGADVLESVGGAGVDRLAGAQVTYLWPSPNVKH